MIFARKKIEVIPFFDTYILRRHLDSESFSLIDSCSWTKTLFPILTISL